MIGRALRGVESADPFSREFERGERCGRHLGAGGSDFGGAAASITAAKQGRLIFAARHWLLRHGETPCRFDCILLDGLESKNIEWLRDAFSAD